MLLGVLGRLQRLLNLENRGAGSLRRLRTAVGSPVPLVVTHDFHANISPAIVDLCDVLITYQQNPHTDTKQRGARAAAYGSAAAMLFAYNASLTKATTTLITQGWGHVFVNWEPYAVLAAGGRAASPASVASRNRALPTSSLAVRTRGGPLRPEPRRSPA